MKKQICKILLVAVCMVTVTQRVSAQNDYGYFNHLSAGYTLGTDGIIGIDVAAPIGAYVQVRAGVSMWPNISVKPMVEYTTSKGARDEVKAKGTLHKTDFKMLFDFFPAPKATSFHITAGAYIGGSKVVDVKNDEPINGIDPADYGKLGIEIGDYLIKTDKNGVAKADIKVNGFKPYVGIGFGRAVPKKTVGVMCDLGVQFWGSPTVYSYDNGTAVKVTSQDLGDKDGGVIRTISKLSVFPVLNIRICGKLF